MVIVLGHNPIQHDATHARSSDGPYCDVLTGAWNRDAPLSTYCHQRAKMKLRDHRVCGLHMGVIQRGKMIREADTQELANARATIVRWRGDACVLEPES